jgi:hypothetical protein
VGVRLSFPRVNVETTLEFWLVALELLALLGFVGYPLVHLARRWTDGAVVASAPVIGLALAALLSWWWVRATDAGLAVGVSVIAALAGVAWIPVVVDLVRRRPDLRDLARAAAVPVVTVVAVGVLFTFHFSSVFRLDHLSSAAGSNVDVAAYSLVAGHLVDEGLSGPGNIDGYDLSARAEGDAFGATSLVAAAAVASGRETWEVGTAVLFVAVAALALSLVALVRRLWPRAGLAAAAAAVVAVANFLFVYLSLQFFLAQILAIALLGAIVVALLAALEATTARAVAAGAGAVALAGVGMIATYPGMAFFAPVVMLAPVLACVRRADWRGGLLRLGVAVVAGVAGAIALAPDLFDGGLRRAQVLGGAQAGWPLPRFLPSDLVGALGTDTPADAAARWIGSAALVAALAGCAVLLWRSGPLARFTVAAWAAAYVSYALVYWREGESYRQWKWITTFLPPLVALAAALAAAAALRLAARAVVRPAVAQAATLAVLAGVVAIQTAKADPYVSRFLGGPAPGVYVNRDLARLADDPRVGALGEISLNLDAVEAQWAATVLRRTTILPLPRPPSSNRPWILERSGVVAPRPGREVVRLDATYQIARRAPASSG